MGGRLYVIRDRDMSRRLLLRVRWLLLLLQRWVIGTVVVALLSLRRLGRLLSRLAAAVLSVRVALSSIWVVVLCGLLWLC